MLCIWFLLINNIWNNTLMSIHLLETGKGRKFSFMAFQIQNNIPYHIRKKKLKWISLILWKSVVSVIVFSKKLIKAQWTVQTKDANLITKFCLRSGKLHILQFTLFTYIASRIGISDRLLKWLPQINICTIELRMTWVMNDCNPSHLIL